MIAAMSHRGSTDDRHDETTPTGRERIMCAARQRYSGQTSPDHSGRAANVTSLPLPRDGAATPAERSLQYAIARIDSSGTVPAAQLLGVLHWRPGDRLAITVVRGVAVFRRDRAGQVSVSRRRALTVPISERRSWGIQPGDSLLLVASTVHGVVFVHPPSVMDRMMALYHRRDDHA